MSTWQLIAALLASLLGGGLIGVILTHRRELPRAQADANKTHAEAESIRDGTLERHIDRLERRVTTLERQVEDCHKDRDLALTAARFLWDRLNTVAPDDATLEPLRAYLARPPVLTPPRSMTEELDKLD